MLTIYLAIALVALIGILVDLRRSRELLERVSCFDRQVDVVFGQSDAALERLESAIARLEEARRPARVSQVSQPDCLMVLKPAEPLTIIDVSVGHTSVVARVRGDKVSFQEVYVERESLHLEKRQTFDMGEVHAAISELFEVADIDRVRRYLSDSKTRVRMTDQSTHTSSTRGA
ncbi:MAG: hypothetical protein FJ279_03010 [Planctomycetes bacterium]|nr:hypothetical protein [Planctomycetota bacterium]